MNDENNNNETNNNIIYVEKIVYKILPSLKKAQKKYVETHKDIIRNINTKYYNKIKDLEEFKNKKAEYYQLNKTSINEKQKIRYKNKKEAEKKLKLELEK